MKAVSHMFVIMSNRKSPDQAFLTVKCFVIDNIFALSGNGTQPSTASCFLKHCKSLHNFQHTGCIMHIEKTLEKLLDQIQRLSGNSQEAGVAESVQPFNYYYCQDIVGIFVLPS